jgi:hypothetical protein
MIQSLSRRALKGSKQWVREKRLMERALIKTPFLLYRFARKARALAQGDNCQPGEPPVNLYRLSLSKEGVHLTVAFSGLDDLEAHFRHTFLSETFVLESSLKCPRHLGARLPDNLFTAHESPAHIGDPFLSFQSYTWIRQLLLLDCLEDGLPARVSKSLRHRDLKGLSLVPYGAHLRRDFRSLEVFYRKIYLPHVTKRYGSAGQVASLRELAVNAASGYILLCTKNGRLWSGGILGMVPTEMRVPWLGVAFGETAAVKDGGMTAIYFEAIKFAIAKGMKVLDFSNSRPFLTDGVFQYKARWGCSGQKPVVGIRPMSVIINRSNPDVANFFSQFPLVHFRENKPRCLCGIPAAGEENNGQTERVKRLAAISEIGGLDLLSFNTRTLSLKVAEEDVTLQSH